MSKLRYTGPDGRPDETPNVAVQKTAVDYAMEAAAAEAAKDNKVGMAPAEGMDTWQKRYSDLRSLAMREKNEAEKRHKALADEIADLKHKLEMKAKAGDAFIPTSEEEITAWKEQYPEAYRMVRTLIGHDSSARIEALEQELALIRNERADVEQEAAFAKLKVLVPDIEEVQADDAFWAWLETRPRFKDTVENTLDIEATADIINIFKGMRKDTKPKAKRTNTNEEAAQTVRRNPMMQQPLTNSTYTFAESQIKAMSSKEYDEKEEAILKAYAENKVLLDITGAAQ